MACRIQGIIIEIGGDTTKLQTAFAEAIVSAPLPQPTSIKTLSLIQMNIPATITQKSEI